MIRHCFSSAQELLPQSTNEVRIPRRFSGYHICQLMLLLRRVALPIEDLVCIISRLRSSSR